MLVTGKCVGRSQLIGVRLFFLGAGEIPARSKLYYNRTHVLARFKIYPLVEIDWRIERAGIRLGLRGREIDQASSFGVGSIVKGRRRGAVGFCCKVRGEQERGALFDELG